MTIGKNLVKLLVNRRVEDDGESFHRPRQCPRLPFCWPPFRLALERLGSTTVIGIAERLQFPSNILISKTVKVA